MKAKVAIYDSHKKAIDAVKTLDSHDFDVNKISLVGKAEIVDDHVQVKSTEGIQKTPVIVGAGAGAIIGLLTGIGVFTIPGFGFLYGAGALVGAIGGLDLGIIGGGIGSILASIGVKEDLVVKYEEHLNEGKFMVVVNGSIEDIEKAEKILHTEGTHLHID